MEKLVIKAQCALEVEHRRQFFLSALEKACELVSFVKKHLGSFVEVELRHSEVNLSVATRAEKHGPEEDEEFSIFRSKQEFSNFVYTLGDLIKASGVKPQRIDNIIRECLLAFAAMRGSEASLTEFRVAFAALTGFFCGGGQKLGKDFDPYPPGAKPIGVPNLGGIAISGIHTLAAIATIAGFVFALQPAKLLPPTSEPHVTPYQIKLVAALLAVSLGTWLGGTGLIVPTIIPVFLRTTGRN